MKFYLILAKKIPMINRWDLIGPSSMITIVQALVRTTRIRVDSILITHKSRMNTKLCTKIVGLNPKKEPLMRNGALILIKPTNIGNMLMSRVKREKQSKILLNKFGTNSMTFLNSMISQIPHEMTPRVQIIKHK